jgi:phytoene dehydrogenase-like protein
VAPLELSRREVLAALLGAPLLGCTSKRRFEGVIAGANDSLGHRLRDGFRPRPSSVSQVPVLILGGGIAGLSAGWRLARAGFNDFRILELDDAPGGTARMGENEISRHPWGAHYLPCPLPHAKAALALLSEMGIAARDSEGNWQFDETSLCRAPQERLFIGDRFYEGLWPAAGASSEDARQLARFQAEVARWSRVRDGRRAFAVPMAHGSDDAEIRALDGISMSDWLGDRRLDSPRLRWFVEYATRDDFGARLEDVSAWAGMHYFASRQNAAFLTWPDGNGRLVAHLARAAGKRLATGIAALDVVPQTRGAAVLAYSPGSDKAETIHAGHVLVALPRSFAARLVAPLRDQPRSYAPPVGAWLVVNLSLSKAPRSRGFPPAWDNVLYGSRSLGYVNATHQLDPGGCAPFPGDSCSRRAPSRPGETVWTWYYPFTDKDPRAGRSQLFSMDWRACADLAIADLRRAHPDIEECVVRLDAWRWGHAMPRPSPGLVFSPARAEAAKPLGDIHFAHTDLSALPLFEEAQYHGVRAAEEILRARGLPFESLL